ncbi:MAG: acetyl-CoA carboxylase biotin carboxyl carrier protein [Pseudobutyrivibrio sp.]|jgi:acetyl-CoA carboxylase biotin carboxyl carrier protein|uniref:acetyl-CoA carboxylase biotin carboxyl carrier protein n=1 Tax=Pseudobutyrivibrio sp. TaxID=2014367 RepID=UPI0025DCC9D5|nr:acetyl-CoA carboxylase biotin carboxyl carrier protein [Pseudobutyrivibrio sp.]MBE5904883.1 acetyl-CoA carboxylase biotin carboxyl carrier protein [Pseudobutyrivibrio sp.]
MELKEIKELMKAFDASGSSYFEIEDQGFKLKLKKPSDIKVQAAPVTVAPQPSAQVAVETPQISTEEKVEGDVVKAPLVGVFYSAPSPDEKPYVQVGDKVKAGQVLCLIEAMKMMSEITAPRDGVIKEIYVKNQDVVGFEEQLFLIGD